MNRINEHIKRMNWTFWLPVLFFFMYMLYTNQSVTLMADDIRYSMRSCFNFVLPQERITTFSHMIETAYFDYMHFCARYGTAILIYFVLLFGTSLYKILNPIMITLQIVLGVKVLSRDETLTKQRSSIMVIVLVLLFSMISPAIMDEDIYWITGAITYSWPVTFLLIHLNLYLFPEKKCFSWQLPLYALLSIYLGSASENISISASLITLFVCGYYTWIEKKENFWTKNKVVSILVLLLANFIQIIAPGTRYRAAGFDNSSLLKNIFSGTFSFAQYQFYLSHLIPAILIILLTVLLFKKNKKLFTINLVYLLPLILLIVVYSMPNIEWIYQYDWICRFIMPLDFYGWGGGMTPPLFVVFIYYIGVIAIFVIDAFILCWKNNFKMFVLLLCSSCSLLALIPIGGAVTRVSYVSIFFMMLTCAYIISYIIYDKRWIIALILPSFYFYSMHLGYLCENVQVAKERERIYASMADSKEYEIMLPKYRFTTHGNFVDEYSWEHAEFKIYYNISDKRILFK